MTVNPTWRWDNAPGGLRNSMYQMDTTAAPYGDIIAHHSNHCVIPTVSAPCLDVQDPFFDIANSPDLYGLSPFDSLYFPAGNQDHVTITPENLVWFLSEACEPLPAPVVVISPSGDAVRLNGSAVYGARSYRVCTSIDPGTWSTQVASTTDTIGMDSDLNLSVKLYRITASTDSAGPAMIQHR